MWCMRKPAGMTMKSDSQKARYPSSFRMLSGRHAVVLAIGMIVPMQFSTVRAFAEFSCIRSRNTRASRNAFSTYLLSVFSWRFG